MNDFSDIATTETASAIAGLRERIDQIDESLIQLWLQRTRLSRQIGAARVAAGGTRVVLSRESEILRRFREGLGDEGVQVALLLLRAGRGPL
ncbi:chorismate mutase [Plantactinospora soyae]|uniref:Chorismate mutase n=1 Tax=Plantactinospora soyae TaxID=1544732 RepID=A0A927R1H2_9ACTN|nr:chorismate mutase [Plantactinospora soyae]MBE1489718.1 chorismate mutase [Plantactinospora soyae]